MNHRVLRCGHCGVANAVGICDRCGRAFVISAGRAPRGIREFDDRPLAECPPVDVAACDFCDAKERRLQMVETVTRGLRQRTCAACHTMFLSAHGL